MPEPIRKNRSNADPPAGAIPIIERIPVAIEAAEKTRLAAIADDLLADEPVLAMTDVFGPRVRPATTFHISASWAVFWDCPSAGT